MFWGKKVGVFVGNLDFMKKTSWEKLVLKK
jgi:hypothetical protein